MNILLYSLQVGRQKYRQIDRYKLLYLTQETTELMIFLS